MKKEASRKDRGSSKGCFTRRRKVAIKAQRLGKQITKFLQTELSFRSLNGFMTRTLLVVVCDKRPQNIPSRGSGDFNRAMGTAAEGGFEIGAGEKS